LAVRSISVGIKVFRQTVSLKKYRLILECREDRKVANDYLTLTLYNLLEQNNRVSGIITIIAVQLI
jgi:hypothetical protein